MDLDWIQRQQFEFSKKHFPNCMNLNHYAIALAGEVGEFCNLVKKLDRGDFDTAEKLKEAVDAMGQEGADILIYLVDCMTEIGRTLSVEYEIKEYQNNERFKDHASGTDQSDLGTIVQQLQRGTYGPGAFVAQGDISTVLPNVQGIQDS